MIAHVMDRAAAAGVGPVFVATNSAEIAAAVTKAGGRAVMTRTDHVSGSDRIFEALERLDPAAAAEIVVNVQGDLPTLDPGDIRAALAPLADPAVDIATIAAEIRKAQERTNPNVVKVVGTPVGPDRLRALYFTRATAPSGDGPLYHHIGLYAYRRRRWQDSCVFRRRRWNGARSSSNCGRSKPACASMSPSSARCRSASTPRKTSKLRARR